MIRFSRPRVGSRCLEYVGEALANVQHSGNGPFTRRCQRWLEERIGCARALLTTSATDALEMCGLVLGMAPGDEIIVPSFTFVTTASAFALRGVVPVFVDIRPDTQNLDETKVEAAITPRTRAIVVVHYAGVACEMNALRDIARRHGLALIEDAAQAILSSYRERPLGSLGDLGVLSFHDTKNVSCGEGGALLINRPDLIGRAEVVWEKGTDRSAFLRGEVDKYTWRELGSSFQPSEITAAVLLSALEDSEEAQTRRHRAWEAYHASLADLEAEELVSRPQVPAGCAHNAHLYYLLLRRPEWRDRFIAAMRELDIHTPFHYVPLHLSPAGQRLGRASGALPHTEFNASRLVRLPLWDGMEDQASAIAAEAADIVRGLTRDISPAIKVAPLTHPHPHPLPLPQGEREGN